jgi:hypothetical protein
MKSGNTLERHPQHPVFCVLLQKSNARFAQESLGGMIVNRHRRVVLTFDGFQFAQRGETPFFEIGVLGKPGSMFYEKHRKSTGN